LFKNRYDSFYIRNSNFITIPNWKIVCTEFSGFKIARFYDKNIKSILKNKILSFYKIEKKRTPNDKKLIRDILKKFKKKYGSYMIYNSILELSFENKIDFSRKTITKIKNKIDF